MTDRELRIEKRWLLSARVDPEQFFRFYDKYRPLIYRYALLKTGDEDIAEDLTAETFCIAQQGLWKFRWQGVTFGAWLYRIVVNLVRHLHRERNRRPHVNTDSLPEIPADEAPPLEALITEEQRQAVYEAVLAMDETSTSIFLLHYWLGHTTEECRFDSRSATQRASRDR